MKMRRTAPILLFALALALLAGSGFAGECAQSQAIPECRLNSDENCGKVAGCEWGCCNCAGTAVQCSYLHNSEDKCRDQDGCEWNRCNATGDCGDITSQLDCTQAYSDVGCNWWGGKCRGTPNCSSITYRTGCSSFAPICEWEGTHDSAGCTGTVTQCWDIKNQEDCARQWDSLYENCDWQVGCTGEPEPCASLQQEQCELNPYCEWQDSTATPTPSPTPTATPTPAISSTPTQTPTPTATTTPTPSPTASPAPSPAQTPDCSQSCLSEAECISQSSQNCACELATVCRETQDEGCGCYEFDGCSAGVCGVAGCYNTAEVCRSEYRGMCKCQQAVKCRYSSEHGCYSFDYCDSSACAAPTPVPGMDCGTLKDGECHPTLKPWVCEAGELKPNLEKCPCAEGDVFGAETRVCGKPEPAKTPTPLPAAAPKPSPSEPEKGAYVVIFKVPHQGLNVVAGEEPIRNITVDLRDSQNREVEAREVEATITLGEVEHGVLLVKDERTGLYSASLPEEISKGEHIIKIEVGGDYNTSDAIHAIVSPPPDWLPLVGLVVFVIIALYLLNTIRSHFKEKNILTERQRFEIAKRKRLLKDLRVEYYKRRVSENEYKERALRVQAEIRAMEGSRKETKTQKAKEMQKMMKEIEGRAAEIKRRREKGLPL